MGPDGEDGNQDGSGPPPDPTMRSWRHPSEIAAAAAAAARPVRPEGSFGRVAGYLLGTAVVGTALFGVALVAIGSTYAFRADQSPTAIPVLAQQQVGAESLTDSESIGVTTPHTEDDPADVVPQSGVSSSTGVVTSDQTLSATGGSTDSTTVPAPGDSLVAADAWFDISTLPPVEQVGYGVFAVSGDRGDVERVGMYVAIDGMVFTSASVVEDRSRLALAGGGTWAPATVAYVDEMSDVAVIEVGGSDGEAFVSAVETLNVAAAPDEPDTDTGISIEIKFEVTVNGPEGGTATGILVGADRRNLTSSGVAVYDLLLTTAKRPDDGSGAALLDADGAVIGLVIDSVGYLTAAMPIDRVIDIGHTVSESEVPTVAWLGVEGANDNGGGVEVGTVFPGSPAEQAGLAVGDVITTFDGTDVIDWYHLVHLVRQSGPGADVTLAVTRDSAQDETTIDLQATIGSRIDELVGAEVPAGGETSGGRGS